MALADRIVVLEGGAVTETGSPATLLASGGYINNLGLKLFPAGENAEESRRNQDALLPSETSHASKERGKETQKAPTDLRRQKGDIGVYKYYISSAGYGVVGVYMGFVTLWEFCTNFSSEF